MELKDFIEKFAEQFDNVDVNELTPETKFKELGEWSSLMSLSIIAMADEEYDVRIKGSDIQAVDTINDLFMLIQSKK
ncbi:acyl carrier protein [Mediterranea sp. An20]|uniref:acyl carrier protein n=1 Tax=Mediterranea sp. An20 TaxID=1965586 RepID=UPI000B37AB7E|nr:acyl carrier protein [Mediterranea sp. An20]OUP09325.1 acyl carrier protein [Mediterranea sp. An20]